LIDVKYGDGIEVKSHFKGYFARFWLIEMLLIFIISSKITALLSQSEGESMNWISVG
jgi:hypothetical protein